MSDKNIAWWEDEAELEKLAESGVSLERIEALIKEAARQKELEDIYADFDAAGRIMAHAYWDEMNKLAEAAAEAKELAAKEKEVAKEPVVEVQITADNDAKLARLKNFLNKK